MKAAALLLAFLAPLRAQAPDSLEFRGLGTSLGRGRSVTARVTFDRSRAAGGGFIYAAPDVGPRDAQALRLSEGLLTTSGGLLGRAAGMARSYRLPALSLPSARWEKGPALVLDSPVFGAPRQDGGGAQIRLVEKTVPLRLTEGEVATLDPARGVLRVYPPWRQADELELASALRAYDGLKDAQSLIQWLAARSTEAASRAAIASRLEEELADRLIDGTVAEADFRKVIRASDAASTPARRKDAAAARRDMLVRLTAEVSDQLDEIGRSLREAGTIQAARRLDGEAEALGRRLAWAADACGSSAGLDRGETARARVSRIFRERAASLPDRKEDDWRPAAAAAGALVPRQTRLGAEFYRRFLADGGLKAAVEEIAEDASLDLSRKSERIRALIVGAKIDPESVLGRDIASRAPPGEMLLVRASGGNGERRAVARPELLRAVSQAWASYWDPALLGARKRKGLPLQPDAELVLEAAFAASASGILYSREPGSGSRERMAVEAAAGELESLKSGKPADQYYLDRRSGREVLPALIADKRVLSVSQLEALAKVGRALENHFGHGVEAEFFFAGDKPVIAGVKPLFLTR